MNARTLQNRSLADRNTAKRCQENVSCMDEKVHGKSAAAVGMQKNDGFPCAWGKFIPHE